MAATSSTMMPLGTRAPDFSLPDTMTDAVLSLDDLQGERGTLILFICNHCPYVLHIKDQLIDIAKHYATRGIATIAISANDIVNYPQDAPDKMRDLMNAWGRPFTAYLYDETQHTAQAYQAACTPDVYLFDDDLKCVYRGRVDGSTPGNNEPPTGKDLRDALDCLLSRQAVNSDQKPSVGCNIKWKKT